jgi:hypothetical protein
MKPEDLLKLPESFRKLVSNIFFAGKEPDWLLPITNLFSLFLLVLLIVWGGSFFSSKIIIIWKETLWPLFHNQEQRQLIRKRQRFAQYILDEILRLNNIEEWKDYRFAELEAEVEAEGQKKSSILPFFQIKQKGLRREKSLSRAFETTQERLILVEGNPGSGKSLALRHVAEKLARQAIKSSSKNSIIPLYINLKKLECPLNKLVDRELIESFAKEELNRVNDCEIERFLDDEFQRGIKEGGWLFLFDSFDELPDVLSSSEEDEVIKTT